jgi:nicotinate-nucleotide--dimethylbenzimidazole phosphoribosyltransferase
VRKVWAWAGSRCSDPATSRSSWGCPGRRPARLAVRRLARRATARPRPRTAAWSQRLPLDDALVREHWSSGTEPAAPRSRLRGPSTSAVVDAHDDADTLLSPEGSLGMLDRVIDRAISLGRGDLTAGTLVLAVGRHPMAELGVNAYDASVAEDVLAAAHAGQALGARAASAAGLELLVVDAGTSSGNLRDEDAMTEAQVADLLERGRSIGRSSGHTGLVALGEIGIGNTTVAATMTAKLLDLSPEDAVGRGAAADSAMVQRKRDVVAAALDRVGREGPAHPLEDLRRLGGPEIALLAGVTLGAAEARALVVLDGLATSVAALIAVLVEPAAALNVVAGQRSREHAHGAVLATLGAEPLLDLRIRAGEGVGAAFAAGLVLDALAVRRTAARTG